MNTAALTDVDTDEALYRLRELRRLQTLQRKTTRKRAERVFNTYAEDPLAWCHDIIQWEPGEGLTDYQAEELGELVDKGRVAARGPRGSGKTMPAALGVLWFATSRDGLEDWKVPTTAGSWYQLRKFLWPEIHRWSRRIDWPKLGRPAFSRFELLMFQLKMKTGEAFAISSSDSDLLEGAHAPHLFAVVDEGKAVPEGSWDAIEGYFSDPGVKYAFAISTPGAPIGRFYDLHRQAPGYEDWHPIHVTIDQAIAAGRVTQEWADQRKRQWGEDSSLYRAHVLAEFAGEEDAAIPLAWIEAAQERWRQRKEDGTLYTHPLKSVGVDVADTGSDDTCLALRFGESTVAELNYHHTTGAPGEGITATAGEVRNTLRKYGEAIAVVDTIGVGAGVAGILREHDPTSPRITVQAFNASSSTDWTDQTGELRFTNKRAAAWWNLRDLLHPDSGADIALPDDPRLLGELTAPKWLPVSSGGTMRLEPKEQIIKRIGRSTDAADAVVMAFWVEPEKVWAFA